MNHYSDPTAQMALGQINREFSKLEKRAKKLRERYEKGEISLETLNKARSNFTGLYRHVLDIVLEEEPQKNG